MTFKWEYSGIYKCYTQLSNFYFISLRKAKSSWYVSTDFVPLNLPLHIKCGMRLRVEWKSSEHLCRRKLESSIIFLRDGLERLSAQGIKWEERDLIVALCKSSTGWFIWNKVWWVRKKVRDSSYNHRLKNSHHRFKVWKAQLVKHGYFKLHLYSQQEMCEKCSPISESRGETDQKEEPEFPHVKILIICGWHFLNVARS